jgi:hypothetical protein
LVDRALEDLGPRIDCILYFKADRLAKEKDPVLRLAGWVAELMTSVDQRPRQRQADWDGFNWWQRLLGDLAEKRFVIVIDDLHRLSPKTPSLRRIAEAILQLADRRGSCRIAIVAPEIPAQLFDNRTRYMTSLRLQPFEWEEVWVWIRRNLPALTRYGKAGLSEYYRLLGNDLAAWRDLGKQVTQARGEVDIAKMALSISGSRQSAPATTVRQRSSASVPRSERPLRIAVAGPFIKGPEAFATAFTQFAAQHGVGGRMVTSQQSVFSSIAELLPIDAPNFNGDSKDVEADLLRWFRTAIRLQPDVVVLDYGVDGVLRGQGPIIERLAARALMIAPAGNGGVSKQVHYPGRLRNVLAVGALAKNGERAEYSSIDKLKVKPELHAPGNLNDSALASALTEKNLQGTSFSALRVAAAAALVWSQHPTSDRLKVREMLIDSARSLSDGIRALDIRKALQMARSEAALDAIRRNALTYPELHASLGLSAAALEPLMDELVKEKKVSVRHDSGVVRYCLEGEKG